MGRIRSKAVMYTVLILFLAVWIFPIYVAVSKSLNINGFDNWLAVLHHPKVSYFRVVANSFIVAAGTAFIVVAITSTAGFAFSKMQFRGKKFLYGALLACLALPVASVTMPLFFTIKTLGLMNSYAGVILPLVSFNSLMMLMLMRNYFDGVPDEIVEAAVMDGASTWGVFRRIMLPLSTPIMATVGSLTFVYSWNEYLIPLLMIRDESKYTVTLAATYFMETRSQTPEMVAQLYAALVMMTIPSVIVYLFSQRYLQAGITAGAVKS